MFLPSTTPNSITSASNSVKQNMKNFTEFQIKINRNIVFMFCFTPATLHQLQSNSELMSATEARWMPRSNYVKKNNQPPIHFLTQSCFLSASWVLCDHREIKILAVQSHYRKAVMLPGPAKPQHQHCCFFTSCMTGKPHLPFRSHCSKPEHLSQVPCALRLL